MNKMLRIRFKIKCLLRLSARKWKSLNKKFLLSCCELNVRCLKCRLSL